MNDSIEWPLGEECSKQRRRCFFDLSPKISRSLSDYATPAEIDALIIAMRERWKELGREMRRLGGKGEGGTSELWQKRRSINRGLKLIRNGQLPILLDDYYGAEDIMAELHARHRAAQAAAYERWEREVLETPQGSARQTAITAI